MRYTLQRQLPGEAFLRVTSGRRWVGRVYRHAATGRWHGRIGVHEGEGDTPAAAFQEAAARALGFSSAAAVHTSNATVRGARRRQRAGARLLAAGMLSTDRATREVAFDVFLDVLTGEKKL